MRPLSLLAALSVLLLNACYPAGDGKPPPVEELYFPTGLALDALSRSEDPEFEVDCDDPEKRCPPKYLYVANSDFDLQYRAGSVISYDLDLLHQLFPRICRDDGDCRGEDICDVPGAFPEDPERVPSYFCVNPNPALAAPCGLLGERDEADRVISPGRCESIIPTDAQVVDAVGIGAFATDVLWRAAPPSAGAMYPSRLFIPVRGDSSLHWIDLEDGKFKCGQGQSDDGTCNPLHRSGDTPSDNDDNLRQPAEPYAVDATSDGAFVGLTNQTTGSVSLYENDWRPDGGPKLKSILSGLPISPVGIAALPEPQFADDTEYRPGFMVAYRTAAQIDLLRVYSAPPVLHVGRESYTEHVLTRAASTPINANSLGFDSRGIVIDDAQRKQEYSKCQTEAGDCTAAANPAQCEADLTRCLRAVHQPDVYVASRAPASLLVGTMTTDPGSPSGTNELPSFTDSVSLTFGPSRVIMGNVKVPGTAQSAQRDSAGPYEFERRVFAVCFDSRRIFVYDPKRRVIDAIVSTGRGPYALAMDDLRGLAYLGHFTDSYLGVISLDRRFPQTYAAIVASIGAPKAPRSSK